MFYKRHVCDLCKGFGPQNGAVVYNSWFTLQLYYRNGTTKYRTLKTEYELYNVHGIGLDCYTMPKEPSVDENTQSSTVSFLSVGLEFAKSAHSICSDDFGNTVSRLP